MIRYWIAVALLAASWLLGLDYFYPANPYAWFTAVAVAVALMARESSRHTPCAVRWMSDSVAAVADGTRSVPATWNVVAIVLLLPAVWFAEWPYRAAPLLVMLGLALSLLPTRRRWTDRLAAGATASGVILFVQAVVLAMYTAHTARSHELPWPLPDMLAGVASLLGIDATADGGGVTMFSMRQTHRLAATWELLLDPATMLFFVGGLAMLAMKILGTAGRNAAASDPAIPATSGVVESSVSAPVPPESETGWRTWIAGLRCLTLIVIAWLPVRAGLLMAIYLHRVLRSDPDRPLHAMNHFFSPWILAVLLIVPMLLAWRLIRMEKRGKEIGEGEAENAKPQAAVFSTFRLPPSPIPLLLVALAVALFTAAIYWCPSGSRKSGRVMVVERHSKWEPTTKPYDTRWFAEPEPFPDVNSGYNYARVYRYLGQYYEMSRLLENQKIDDETLDGCDVLIVKTPTVRYAPAEAAAVTRFVERGGGLLLVGDHTNVERSGTIMNDIARPMGFIFRDDLLFSFGKSPDEQFYEPPAVPHPIVQYVPPMDFAVSCSIDPGSSPGRAAICNTGLWSMGPEYHNDNFHPVPQHCPAMRGGAFIQTWAARHGDGRVVAFTDSTIFSNFCAGQPGKSELLLGMVEWLNHANPWLDPRAWLVVLGILSLGGAGFVIARRGIDMRQTWLVLLAAGACGWALASVATAAANRWNLPEPERLRPERCVTIDRETSTVPLSKGAYTQGDGQGYGLLEQWIARLDCHTVRRSDSDLFSGDTMVVICPSRSVSDDYRRNIETYVADGGRLLVIDSPENINSTANSVLWPFGISIHHDRAWKGSLTTALKLPAVEVTGACEVVGGQAVARIGQLPVAAAVRHGRGSVLAIGFGSLWNDTGMGETWTLKLDANGKTPTDIADEDLPGWKLVADAGGKLQPRLERAMSPGWMLEPDATVRARYDVFFGLAREFFDDKPWPAFPAKSPEKKNDAKDSLLKESGPAEL